VTVAYHFSIVKTLTVKLPDALFNWLEAEAKRANRPKGAIAREILQDCQQKHSPTALDLAGDLCGCVQSGIRNLSRSKKHMDGFGR